MRKQIGRPPIYEQPDSAVKRTLRSRARHSGKGFITGQYGLFNGSKWIQLDIDQTRTLLHRELLLAFVKRSTAQMDFDYSEAHRLIRLVGGE
jgi:hypothetical protein